MIFLFTVPIWLGIIIWIAQMIIARDRKLYAAWQFSLTHKKCPECAEFILREAKICKHCGTKQVMEVVEQDTRPAPQEHAMANWDVFPPSYRVGAKPKR